MKLLIVEDEQELASSINSYLQKEGIVCDIAENLMKANEFVNLTEYDCILVDIMLPDGSGLSAIEEVKKVQPKCGIIIISAKNSLDDKVTGLDIGADDYITKPFHLAELNSRIKSVIRRRNFDGSNIITLNELSVDLDKRKVMVNDKTVELTRREYDILVFFISNKERVLTKESITEHIWGDDSNTFDNFDFVYTHVKNLRRKLNESGSSDYIRSIYGVGYKFSIE